MSPNYSDATLVCYYQNVRGLNSKTHDFYSSVLCDDCDIVCLSETWLSAGVADSEIFPPDYDVFRHDRDLEAANSATGEVPFWLFGVVCVLGAWTFRCCTSWCPRLM